MSHTIRSTLLAAALVLGGTAAQAQDAPRSVPDDVSPAASLGYSASPLGPQGYVGPRSARPARELTVMGMTGGIEAKEVESTGSLGGRPAAAYGRTR